MSWKKALKVISETLGHFANTLNVGHKYSRLNRDNLTVPIQMQLSLTEKLFPNFFFFHFRHQDKILDIFKKKDYPHVFVKLRTPKNVVRYMSKKYSFRGPFHKQHGKRDQTLSVR